MTAPLDWTTVNEGEGRAVVTVRGRLDLATAPSLRQALLKCLAEQPEALLIDLSGMEVAGSTALSLFTSVARQAASWPGTPVLLCAPPAVATELEHGRYGKLTVHPDLDAARRAAPHEGTATRSVFDRLLPVTGAVRHARDMATDACARWGLPHLTGPACLVVSELVANAVEHAGTMITLQICHRGRYLNIAVHDGSPTPPELIKLQALDRERGRGIMLVDSVAAHWGWLPSREGKVVWATLAT
ncbi:anti-anti-sigma factor [Krasilnikovia cinnamomea]|uniref:Anti-anti-sigma factor n=1 Tax=Krasilnikovia cinnamomea TaxID=349313 RepID=A0A4Q7ZSD4_9ACTN|nr:STAS domain-containing protein [Krasilnikovia cinnamomea]RZU54092.1 anti-anti-sigma factor [Krasilnikovia cinnamomea]